MLNKLYLIGVAILGLLVTLFVNERGKRKLTEKDTTDALREAREQEATVETLVAVDAIKQEGVKNDVKKDNTGRPGIGGSISLHDDKDSDT